MAFTSALYKTAQQIAAESDREMKRYDDLGPLARAAVANAPRIIDIGKVVSDFKSRRDPSEWDDRFDGYPPLDLKDAATDKRLADKIDSIVRNAMGKSIADCTLVARRQRRR